jgi:hypothetical protein
VIAAKSVVVLLSKKAFVAKRLVDVEFVVDAFVAAKRVAVAFANAALVP